LIAPGNFVKLTDFGLVRDLSSSQLTRTGAIIGTVEYMSPEQTITAKVDSRSDIYSLGLMIYKAFTGKLPFQGGLMQKLVARTKEEVPDPVSINPKLDKKICGILRRMLRRHPRDRYPDVQILFDELVNIRERLFGKSHITSTSSMTIEAPVSLLLPPVCTGRERELKLLKTSVNQLRIHGQNSLILIRGDAGTGKTRLVEEIRTIASFSGTLFASCSKNDRSAFRSWIDLYESITEDLKQARVGILPPFLRNITLTDQMVQVQESMVRTICEQTQINQSNNINGLKETAHYKFFDLIHRYLSIFSSQLPMVLHLDDFHGAGKATLELLQFIIRRTVFSSDLGLAKKATGKMMVIVSYRKSELTPNHPLSLFERIFSKEDKFHIMDLRSLNQEQVNEMVASMLGGEHASPSFCKRIFEGTGGNPLFIESTINNLVEEKLLRRRGNIWVGAVSQRRSFDSSDTIHLVLPATIKESIRRRLAGLSEIEVQLASAAAVLEKPFTFNQLLFVSEQDEDTALDALDGLIKTGMLKEQSFDDEEYAFCSSHLRDVIYEDLSENNLQTLHRLAAEYIEKEHDEPHLDVLANLAFHYIKAESRINAYPVCKKVADLFFKRSNIENALYFVDQALRFASGQDKNEQNKLLLIRADCLIYLGHTSEATEILREIIRSTSLQQHQSTDDKTKDINRYKLQCRALVGLASVHKIESKPKIVKKILEAIVAKANQYDDKRSMLNAKALLGAVFIDLGELNNAFQYLSTALTVSKKEEYFDIASKCYHNLGNLSYMTSKYEKAKNYYDSALIYAQKSSDESIIPAIKNNLANILKQKGKYEMAATQYREAVQTAESLGDYSSWPLYLHNLAMVQVYTGKRVEAIRNYQRSLAVFEENRAFDKIAMCLNNLGELLFNSGKSKEAYDVFKQSYDIFHNNGFKLSAAAVLTNLGSLSLELELFDKAEKYLFESKELYCDTKDSIGYIECEVFRGYLAVKRNQLKDAERILNKIHLEDHLNKPTTGYYHLAIAELGLALLETGIDRISPEHHFSKCIDIFQHTARFHYLNKTGKLFGNYLINTGKNPERGHKILTQYLAEQDD